MFSCGIIFPAVLGNYAEDGTIQGRLCMMDVLFTTPDVLGSAVDMDKDVTYRLFRDAGIVGKTSTKLTLAHMLAGRKVSYMDDSHNNGLRLYLSVFQLNIPSRLISPLAWCGGLLESP